MNTGKYVFAQLLEFVNRYEFENIYQATGLRADKTIELKVAKSKKLYPEKLRLIEYYEAEKDNFLVL